MHLEEKCVCEWTSLVGREKERRDGDESANKLDSDRHEAMQKIVKIRRQVKFKR